MSRLDFNQLVKSGCPLVTPVIHVQDAVQTLRNLDVLDGAGCPGAFLINHDFPMAPFLPILTEVRAARPDFWLGVNFLAQSGRVAFPVLGELARQGHHLDAYWADDGCIDERAEIQTEAEEIARIRAESGWQGLYLGGVAFKKQRPVAPQDYAAAAQKAGPNMDAVCTSGIATGQEADPGKIAAFRKAIGGHPLALASGITPQNAASFAATVDLFLVATGINYDGDFYNIDPARLNALLAVTRREGKQE